MVANSLQLSYKGTVTFELVDSILHIISCRLDVIEENISIRKKVYGILMETLQNLCNHIENHNGSKDYDFACAILTVEMENDTYSITTGNFIVNSKVQELKNWLDEINDCSAAELKQLYNKVLTNSNYSSKGGGGLGFIDIARKSSNRLNYEFAQIDARNSFFTLNIRIKRQS